MRLAVLLGGVLTVALLAVAQLQPPWSWLRWLLAAGLAGAATLVLGVGAAAQAIVEAAAGAEPGDRRFTGAAALACALYAGGFRLLGSVPAGAIPEGPLDPWASFASLAALAAGIGAVAYGYVATGTAGRAPQVAGAASLLGGLLALGPSLALAGMPSLGPVGLAVLAALALGGALLRMRRR